MASSETLMNKNVKSVWNENHETQFSSIEAQNHKQLKGVVLSLHSIKCDTFRTSLVAVWNNKLFTSGKVLLVSRSQSRYLSEERFRINDLELLDVVWSIE